MNIKKLIFGLVMAVIMMPAAGCSKGIDYEPMELVPQGADLIAEIQVSEVLRNWQIYSGIEGNEETAKQFDEMKKSFVTEVGIDLNDISRAVAFADLETAESVEYAAFILTGNFVDKDLIKNIEEKTGSEFSEEEYGNFTLYVTKDDESGIVRINKKMIIMGSIKALKDCIDITDGKLSPVSGILTENFNSMEDSTIRLSMIVPEDARESFMEQPEAAGAMVPIGMKAFADMQTIGMASDITATTMMVKVNIGFSNTGSAGKAGESLETLLDFMAMMGQDEEQAELLDRIVVTVGGSRVYLSYELTLAELMDMAESLENGMPMTPFGPPDMEFPGEFKFPDGEFKFPSLPED